MIEAEIAYFEQVLHSYALPTAALPASSHLPPEGQERAEPQGDTEVGFPLAPSSSPTANFSVGNFPLRSFLPCIAHACEVDASGNREKERDHDAGRVWCR